MYGISRYRLKPRGLCLGSRTQTETERSGHLQNPAIGELLRRQAVSASRASAAAALSPTAPAPSPPPPRRRDESNSGRVCLGSRGRITAENPRALVIEEAKRKLLTSCDVKRGT
uniref:Uncharacterized protein n=1 Tax=Oryza sativa subsp. japonica TaxID=39947 RepID=Q6K8T3_ORYSJ|nr:hypothetical protein [Oryza sativa Japonica Group]BAD21646.1 hypothetical protein [Oryza sativa Japonica Group]